MSGLFIVGAIRMDIGLSCFKTHFMAPALGYCCDLDDFGTFYRHYDMWMNYWHQVMPENIYELRYEDPGRGCRATDP